MSENLDLVRSIYADWKRGDFGSVEWADPEIDFVSTDGPAPGVSPGVAGMTKAWRDMLVGCDNLRVERDEYREPSAPSARAMSASHYGMGRILEGRCCEAIRGRQCRSG